MPSVSSKPVRSGSPRLGRFDSCAAPSEEIAQAIATPSGSEAFRDALGDEPRRPRVLRGARRRAWSAGLAVEELQELVCRELGSAHGDPCRRVPGLV
jgi:hypothetical protein